MGSRRRQTEATWLRPSNVSSREWAAAGWGWWFGRPERRQLRLCYLVMVQSWPGKMAAEMSKRSSQVAPGQLEDYGPEVG